MCVFSNFITLKNNLTDRVGGEVDKSRPGVSKLQLWCAKFEPERLVATKLNE